MKLQLVYATSSKYPKSSDLSGWCPPLGLLAIATELKKSTDAKIEVYDSQVQDRKWIAERLCEDIIGISCDILSYENALYFAEKTKSARVIMGEPYVSSIPETVIANLGKTIDHVVGHGTPTPKKLILGEKTERIENNIINLQDQPIPNRSLVPKDEYFKVYKKRFPNSIFQRPTGMVPQIGCAYKSKGKGCVFCSGPALLTGKTPEQFWEELEELKNQSYDYVSVQGEDFLGYLKWFNQIYNLRPKRNLPLDITTKASRRNERTIERLKDLNVRQIFIGGESGSQKLLDSSLKGMRKEQVEKAVRLMGEYGIKTKITFVLGLPRETQETLNETREFVRHLADVGDIGTIGVSILTPIPGSPAYHMFCEKFPSFKNYDVFSIGKSRRLWVDTFCNVNYSELEKATKEISSIATSNYGFAR